ncbi:hypothetical protein [Alteraurantiacibacter aquimixticola]|uniref:Uncharacterized protein n=1 Tax=Alteraurantiacibacter aquimixticola TaxID=2489173 RepID=A0A4T3F2V1_9SPHN|nr:hypothetical protein [Alteraurantiacibacter aquimixticola]TIX48940.1 hypothetical protein E5222_14475 [Alteraurantiacibacter aquimixticola]
MKTTARIAILTAATLALTACGSTTDASEDAIADNVEMPADQALTDTPMPVEDEAALTEDETALAEEGEGMDAMEAAETAEEIVAEDAEAAAE